MANVSLLQHLLGCLFLTLSLYSTLKGNQPLKETRWSHGTFVSKEEIILRGAKQPPEHSKDERDLSKSGRSHSEQIIEMKGKQILKKMEGLILAIQKVRKKENF